MIFYVIFILLLLLLFLIEEFLNRKYNIRTNIFSNIALYLIVGVSICRFDVGDDFSQYYMYFLKGVDVVYWEPFSSLIYYISFYLNSPQLFFAIFGILTFCFFYTTIKKNSVDYKFSLFIYVCIFYLNSFSLVRQYLAVSICFWAYRYIKSSSFIRYIGAVLFAMMFHYTAVIALIIYPASKKMRIEYIPLYVLFVFFFLSMFLKVLSYTKYGVYIENIDVYNQSGKLIVFFFLFIIAIGLPFSLKLQDRISFLIMSLFIPFSLCLASASAMRLGLFFLIYMTLFIPIICYRKAKRKLFWGVLFALYFLFSVWYSVFVHGEFSQYVPYQFFFNVENIDFK